MKKALIFILVLAMSFSMFSLSAFATSTDDWAVGGKGSYTKAQSGTGVQLVSSGHYPEDNAGIIYKTPLDINAGIDIDLSLDINVPNTGDTWFCFQLLSQPNYFKISNFNDNDGKGVVVLCRPDAEGDCIIQPQKQVKSFSAITTDISALDIGIKEDLTAESVDLKLSFSATKEGKVTVKMNGVQIGSDGDFDYLLTEAFENGQCYFGFSTSDGARSSQAFTIKTVNGKPAAEEKGSADEANVTTAPESIPADAPDLATVEEFTLFDFTNKDFIASIADLSYNCTVEYDEAKGCMKTTSTTEDPYITLTIPSYLKFKCEDFDTMKIEYASEAECGEFELFVPTSTNADIASQNFKFSFDSSADVTALTYDMDIDNTSSGSWDGEIVSFRIDPLCGGSVGDIAYIKSISFVRSAPEAETTAPDTTAASDTTKADTTAPQTTVAATTAVANNKAAKDDGIPTWVWIVAGAVVVVAAAGCVYFFVIKKKK